MGKTYTVFVNNTFVHFKKFLCIYNFQVKLFRNNTNANFKIFHQNEKFQWK